MLAFWDEVGYISLTFIRSLGFYVLRCFDLFGFDWVGLPVHDEDDDSE